MLAGARALVVIMSLDMLAAGCVAHQATSAPAAPVMTTERPYLVIEQAAIAPTGVCRPGEPVIKVTARVANLGTAPSVAVIGLGMVSAMHARRNWGNGGGLPALQPGERVTVAVPVYYLIDEPGSMPGAHTFHVRLNGGGWFPADTARPEPVPATVMLPDGCPAAPPALAE
jgi:hypothetical protein